MTLTDQKKQKLATFIHCVY